MVWCILSKDPLTWGEEKTPRRTWVGFLKSSLVEFWGWKIGCLVSLFVMLMWDFLGVLGLWECEYMRMRFMS